ncbi:MULTISPECIES: hypothetical protein [Pseudomonas]|uniref:Uncharacterized protein n=1 Tax=Pseudomonas auratipiscis TaxID=3115853 RepID=A0AB35WMD1_9PSED|nr:MULTISPECIES: hypothetical protein [unclassified Pseudomonas]MEE1865125.1 hypothetical protein [Pseudomonas sp. 120P]MEE1955934.1 hypothetical protein [Pseudomonas sp. 119P]
MQPWKKCALSIIISLSAILLFTYAISGTPDNPDDPSDTRGIPVAAMYTTIIIVLGLFSWGALLIGLLVNWLINPEWRKSSLFISLITSLPLFLTSALGVFCVAAFASDSVRGISSGALFFLVMVCLLWKTKRSI